MKRIKPSTRAIVMACACAIGSLLAASGQAAPIQRIYLVHFSHTDFGITDRQSACRDLQVRYQLITGSKFLHFGQHADGVRFE